jgi:membrane protein DedA with SNARE-associated domain
MSFESFVEHYGYLAVLLGTFFEGETIVIIAGFLAHRGHLDIGGVTIAAFVGALLGDQLYFHIGRWKGREFVSSRPRLNRHSDKVERLLHKHRVWLILGFRFVYGLRTVTPFVLGASQLSARLFLALNSIGAFVWALAIGYAGYYFGAALEAVVGRVKQYELLVIGMLAGIALAIWTVRFLALHHSKSKT